MRIATAEQMRTLDRRAIEERGVPSLELMERAANALAEAAIDTAANAPGAGGLFLRAGQQWRRRRGLRPPAAGGGLRGALHPGGAAGEAELRHQGHGGPAGGAGGYWSPLPRTTRTSRPGA